MRKHTFVYMLGLFVITSSCNKKNNYDNTADVIREWNFNLSSGNENHAISGNETSAAFHMVALSDNSLRYDINVGTAEDKILGAKISSGDPISEGSEILNLSARIANNYVSGTVTGIRQSLMDSLLNNNIEKYVNVITQHNPTGLVRGQLNSNVVIASNVQLTGTSVVPPVTTNTTGTAYIRLTSDKILYSNVVISNDDPADPVTKATVNNGVVGSNGSVLLNLVNSAAEFGIPEKNAITENDYNALTHNNTYVVVSSASNPTGKLRGQLR